MAERRSGPPKKGRFSPRSLIYVMIPLGFVLLVGLMLVVGRETPEIEDRDVRLDTDPLATSTAPPATVEEPVGGVYPSPSGPEYGDNAVVLE